MSSANFGLATERDTQLLAQYVAPLLTTPFCLTLSGEIGAGKTTFIRAMLRSFGVEGTIRSPTFSIVESYDLPQMHACFHHFDLYRIASVDELDTIGFRDFFTPNSICCVEWPERAVHELGLVDLEIHLQMQSWLQSGHLSPLVAGRKEHIFEVGRLLNMQANTVAAIDLLSKITKL